MGITTDIPRIEDLTEISLNIILLSTVACLKLKILYYRRKTENTEILPPQQATHMHRLKTMKNLSHSKAKVPTAR